MFPAAVIARLYVNGSLKNTPTGFQFKLRNIIDSGTLVGLGPLTVDEVDYAPEAIKITMGEKELRGSEITRSAPLSIWAYREATIDVDGAPLTPGPHKLVLPLLTREAGKLQLSVTVEAAA